MRRQARIVCVGCGITGAYAAYLLARRGVEVTIVERDGIARHASGHNAGGLNPLHGPGIPGPMAELALESMRLHTRCWDEIRRLSGIEFGGRTVRRLHLVLEDDAELARLEELHLATPGFSARRLSGVALRQLDPRLAHELGEALLTDGNARIDPLAYTRAVAGAAIALGARLVRDEVCDLRARGNRVTQVVLPSRTIACDGVVIATGPWCSEPARWLGTKLAIEPVKGELLLAVPSAPPPDIEVTWREFGAYPAAAGRLWLGGTEERVGMDTRPTDAARRRILGGVRRLLPGVAAMRIVRQVTGLRPVTPDGFPILGLSSGWDNVCLATGAGRKGMLLGAALGLAACELLLEQATRLPIACCDPSRPAVVV
jgi:glycine/D-amino acid oxidase-like deaminating enzyme